MIDEDGTEIKEHDGIHVFGGGTMFHVRPHLSLSARAYGKIARQISARLMCPHGLISKLHMTRMAAAGGGVLETNDDVAARVDELVADPSTKMVFMTAALCDFEGSIVDEFAEDDSCLTPSGKNQPRLRTSRRNVHTGEVIPISYHMQLTPAPKVIRRIREVRKDIFLVGCKTTAGKSPEVVYRAGLELLKTASCNLVLANDVHTRLNMVITPEQARYHVTTDRQEVVAGLVEMAVMRSKLSFTRSAVVPGDPVPWASEEVPHNLRTIVDYCVAKGAYKPFLGSTVGHFAVKLGDGEFLTSRRKTNFNKLGEVGLVRVKTDGPDNVVAFGSRPSVGGQSQRIIFAQHPDVDCILHFHCKRKPDSLVPVRSQRAFECGSHECGQNTSSGLQRFDVGSGQSVYAVMLDQHGPNIVFNRNVGTERLIKFVEENFQLGVATDAFEVHFGSGPRVGPT